MQNLRDPIETTNWGGLIGKITGNSPINPLLRAAALFTPPIAYLAAFLPTGAFTYILLALLTLLVLGVVGCFVFMMLTTPVRRPSETGPMSELEMSRNKDDGSSIPANTATSSIIPELAELWEVAK